MPQLKKKGPLILALLITLLYFGLPLLADWIGSIPRYSKYAQRDIPRILDGIQRGLLFPIEKWLSGLWRGILIFPYWFVIFLGMSWVYQKTKTFWRYAFRLAAVLLVFLFLFPNTLLWLESSRPSISHGSVRDGRIEGAKRLPFRGDNFTTYSFPGYLFGRTFVHERVRKTVLDAFAVCKTKSPDATFVIGETGLRKGGIFHPHRTHRNGLSIDIMTPMLRNQRPYRRNHLFNLWGYAIEFDDEGRLENGAHIDYESLAECILAIKEAARENGLTIQKVIFDPVLRPGLFATEAGRKIRDLPYTKNRIILRHDDHFHVDFAVAGQ
ncbi:MAG: penicillin-insensitive murein endopeptidase [Saprospiraceae bacterium]|nr:penicillin-insensitive murein endopeptidase [Lewinella sp.]